jgi:chitinase
MEEALPKIGDLKNHFLASILAIGLPTYEPSKDVNDAAFALAVPVQMLAQAVDNMGNIKELGSKIKKRKKRETILLIVSLVLMIVPFLGEVGLGLAGFTALARFAFVGGEIANGALTVAEIINDPQSAPVAIVGLLIGAAGRDKTTEDIMSDASAAKWKMRPQDIASMGSTFKMIDDKVQTVVSRCVR